MIATIIKEIESPIVKENLSNPKKYMATEMEHTPDNNKSTLVFVSALKYFLMVDISLSF